MPLAACSGEDAGPPSPSSESKREIAARQSDGRKVRIRIGEKTLFATLRDNATAKDFASLLPLTLSLEDYAKTEKISDLPRKLTRDGAPAASDPAVGDIAYYSPWGNLAIYYKDSGTAQGLIILGKIDGGLEALTTAGAGKVTIELAEL